MSHILKFALAPVASGLSQRASRSAATATGGPATGASRCAASGLGNTRDDTRDEMTGDSDVADARRRERARCAAIFACEAAAGNLALAAHLAFNTTLTRREAVKALRVASAAAAPAPSRRQQIRESWAAAHAANRPRPQQGDQATLPKRPSSASAAAWDRAHAANAPRAMNSGRKR
ncbi:MAG: hypothetical protein ACTHL8_18915 [Burkholderiaceae bacterium]